MDHATRDTIYALSSAPGRAGVAVVRVSGPMAGAVIERLTRKPIPEERRAIIRTLYNDTNGERIDTALALYFPGPHSYTGENTVEFQIHGGRAVLAALFDSLAKIPGLRAAEPGEFTRRAVAAGKLDLTQAEAINDLIAAETEAQRKQALRQFEGELATLYEGWRARLIASSAWLEAVLDFPDEEIPAEAMSHARAEIAAISREIQAHLGDGRRGEILREGLHVAVIGPPNAGKSSLVNTLARRDVAIVSEIAGTTRDVIEVRLDLGGYPVILADTAGLREAEDRIEQEGVRRAEARAAAADIRLLVLDGAAPAAKPTIAADITVFNKADIAKTRIPTRFYVSAKTGEGIAELIAELAKRAEKMIGQSEAPALTRARYREALAHAVSSLDRALAAPPEAAELAAEEVRQALHAIGRITGRVDLDEVLDVVFRDFCIGK